MTNRSPNEKNTAEAFVDSVEVYKNSALNNKDLLVRIVNSSQPDVLGELAFYGKYIWKLYRTLQSHALENETLEKLQEEFARAVNHFMDTLQHPVQTWSAEQREDMDHRFFHASQECLRRIIMLAEDFFWVKNVEIQFKDKLP